MNNHTLDRKSIYFEIFNLSWPIVLSQIGNIAFGFSNIYMVARVDTTAIADANITAMSAVSVANSIFIVFLVLGMGTIAASAPLIASSKAAKSYSECGEILRSAIELSFIIAFIITSSLLIISENIHFLNGFFKESKEVLDMVQVYLRLVAISTIPYMLFLAVKQFGDGLSITKPAMIITLMGVVLNIFLNIVLMYGGLSFPPMGVKGLALSTIITRSFMAIALIIVVFNNVGFKDFLPPLISRFNTWPVLVKIVKIGLPGGIQLFFEVGAFTAAGFMAMKLGGTHYVAAHAVAHTLSSVTYMLAMGISIAGSILVGKAFGNHDKEKILLAGKSVIVCGVLFMAFWAFVFFVFGENLTILIVGRSDPELMSISRAVLIVVGIYQLFDGLQVVGLGILRGIEDVNKPTIITLVAYWLVALPCSYVFGFYMDYKLTGIWLGLMVGLMVSAILLNYRFFRLVLTGKMSQYQSTDLKDLN